MSGSSEKNSSVSKQKISATGAAAAPDGRERQARPHVADVAVGAGQRRDRGFGKVAADREGETKRQRQHQEGGERGGQDEAARC